MRKRFVYPFLIFLMLITTQAWGLAVLSTDSGPSQQDIKTGVSEGIFESVAKHAGDWVADGMDRIGDWAVQTLFKIYDKYIGTFLIKIPDLASPRTYMALSGDPGGAEAGQSAVSVVLNILKITSGTGLFLLIVGFVIDTGQRSSGLWDRFVDASVVIGFVAAFLALFAWPTIHSYLTNGATAMGYYIYNQNTLRTSGVLQGFQNIDLDSGGGAALRMDQFDFRGNFITTQGIAWNFIYLISISLVVLGFYNCYSAVSAGDTKKGNHRFFQAVAGMVLILGIPTIVHVLIARGADKLSSSPVIPGETLAPFSVQGLVGEHGIRFPQEQGRADSTIGTAGDAGEEPDKSRIAKFSAGLLKCGISIWGLIICFAVIFAKFFQVLNIWVIFILGPIFIGCLGHPSTAPIFWGGMKFFVKLLLFSVIWAITLVGLYLIPNIDWGVETIGVNSLLTAVAVLAGLQMISNAQDFASLFTSFKGGNIKGEGINTFTSDTKKTLGTVNAARLGTFGMLKGATGETGQAVGTAAGAAVGSMVPVLGTAGGAMAGQRMVKGMNMLAQAGSIGGKAKRGEGQENPASGLLQKFSGGVIAKSLDRESGKMKDLSSDEKAKRKLVGDYAKKLQTGGAKPRPGTGYQGHRGPGQYPSKKA